MRALRQRLRGRGNACVRNSFVGATPVLMADGRELPISRVELGDYVLATDPKTGETSARRVTDVITGAGAKTLVRITLAGGEQLTATGGHPFWVESRGEWVDAERLQRGNELRGPEGERVVVEHVVVYRVKFRRVFNLTVAGVHTYYAGAEPVLVHNQGDCTLETERAARREAMRRNKVQTSLPNNYQRREVYGKNRNLRGPRGEPYETLEARDLHGRVVRIEHHKHGHVFPDVDPPRVRRPHYQGPKGEHIEYRRVGRRRARGGR